METSFLLELAPQRDKRELPYLINEDTNIPLLLQTIRQEEKLKDLAIYAIYYVLYKKPEKAFELLTIDDFYMILNQLKDRTEYKKYYKYFVDKIEESVSHLTKLVVLDYRFSELAKVNSKFIYNVKPEHIEYLINGKLIIIGKSAYLKFYITPQHAQSCLNRKISDDINLIITVTEQAVQVSTRSWGKATLAERRQVLNAIKNIYQTRKDLIFIQPTSLQNLLIILKELK